MCLVISNEILCSLGRGARCLKSYDTTALSTLLPTLITPLLSTKGLRASNSFFIPLCRLFCALLNHRASASCNSLGVRGPFWRCPPLCLAQILRDNLWISAVTLISLRQLENLWGLIALPFSGVVTVPTIFSWRYSISSSFGVMGAVSWGHSGLSSQRNSKPWGHFLFTSCTGIPFETSSATLNSPGMCRHWIG